jgi:hypothetical protein
MLRRVSLVWPQNQWCQFLQFDLKTGVTVSPCLASKPAVDFLFEPQNQGDGVFLGLGLKTDSYGLVI